MPLKTFIRLPAYYQAYQKRLPDDLEITSIVSNADPMEPVVVGGGEGVSGINTRKVLAYSAEVAMDASEGFNIFRLTLNGDANITIGNMDDMQSLVLVVYKTNAGDLLSLNGADIPLQDGTTTPTLVGFFKDGANIIFDSNAGTGGGATADTTAPTVVSATTIDANTIDVVLSEIVTATNIGWSFKQNGAAIAPDSISGSGTNTLRFVFSETLINTDTLLRSYDSATGDTMDAASNELVSFTDQAVTNTLAAAGETLLTSGTLGETAGATMSSGNEFINIKASTRVQVAGMVNRVRYNLDSASYTGFNRIRVWRKAAGVYNLVGETQDIAGPYNDAGTNEEVVTVPFAVQVGDYVGMILGSGSVDTAAPTPGVSDMAYISGTAGATSTGMNWDGNGAGDTVWGAAYIELIQD